MHRVNEDILFANHLIVEDMHRLGEEAEALLVEKQIVPPDDWIANTRIGGRSTSPSKIMRLAHDHMASDIALDIEIGARKAGVAFKSHIDILREAPASTLMQDKPLNILVTLSGRRTFIEPDALFALGGRVFAWKPTREPRASKASSFRKSSPIARSLPLKSSTAIWKSTIFGCCSRRPARSASAI